MTPVFSPDIIARVKDETDIVEIVRQHVDLKPAGAVFKGLCPFHKEKTPSFIVTPARDRYHCFGCGTGGDVISFVMETEGVSFPEAVEILARPLDLDLSDWLKEDESEGERRAFYRANSAATDIWKQALMDEAQGRQALAYLTDRGFSTKVLRDFDVGWAPANSPWLVRQLASAGIDQELALQADLLRKKNQEAPFAYFRSRIIFPIKSISRQVAGFGGRVIDQGEPKYLNSADSPYFTKGNLLYGFDYSRMAVAREKSAILVEGYLDLLAMVQVGFNNVVATCGTAFTAQQARLVRRGAPVVYLLFDGDKAGRKASVRSADVALRAGLEPKIASLPQGMDPADVVMASGRQGLVDVLEQARGYVGYLRELVAPKWDDRTVKERAVKQILTTVYSIPDALRQEYVLQETAETFELGIDLLRSMVEQEANAARKKKANKIGFGRKADSATEGEMQGGKGPTHLSRVKPLARINTAAIEIDLFTHVLMDPTGRAAEVLQGSGAGVEFGADASRILAQEIEEWLGIRSGGDMMPLKDFLLGRWNLSGGQDYRSFVSRLIDQPERPPGTDFVRITKDCLERLRQSSKTHSS